MLTMEQQTEALALLRLINMEFQSDPMSVQCFDLRLVERVRVLASETASLDISAPK